MTTLPWWREKVMVCYKLNYLIKNVSLIQYEDFYPIYHSVISEGEEIVRTL